jgi:hypothetical protein
VLGTELDLLYLLMETKSEQIFRAFGIVNWYARVPSGQIYLLTTGGLIGVGWLRPFRPAKHKGLHPSDSD